MSKPKTPHIDAEHIPDLAAFADDLGSDWVLHAAELSSDQRRALAVLLYAPSIAQAAEWLGIKTARLYAWMKKDKFREALEAIQNSSMEQGARYLESCWTLGITTMVSVARESEEPKDRLAAAKALTDLTMKYRKIRLDEKRLDAIEERLTSLEVDWSEVSSATPEEAERLFSELQRKGS